jgi:TonB-linked SusC/RagA family outer membrane protein
MKKKQHFPDLQRFGIKKLLLVMKLTTILLFLTGMAFAANTFSQEARFDLSVKNASIIQVFDEIERITDYGFLFKTDQLDVNKQYTLDFKNSSIEKILNEVLDKNQYSYQFINRNIVITRIDSNVSSQQQKSVSGKVTDSSGATLPGVSVVVKGTTTGTITDANGKYSLANVPMNATLLFSFVGMKSQEIASGDKTTINVILAEESIGIEEVVAVGYGTVKKSDLTGSIGSIDAQLISKTNLTDAGGALQGKVAGVNITKNVARPGSGFTINIRGVSSINNSNSPLFVIDGIPTSSGLTDLNPEDIEKIDILKDASATAIYGSRGANGVVIVSTKKGKAGKFTVQYDGSYGYRTPNNLPDMMNGPEYVQWRTDLYTNLGKSTARSNADFFTGEEWEVIDQGKYTNWMDLMFRNGFQTSNTLTASGGDDKGTFALSIGQLKEEGTFTGQDYSRYNMRLNLSRKFLDKWQVGGNLYFTNSVQNIGSYESVRSTYRIPPVAIPYNSDGSLRFLAYRNDGVKNPLFENLDDGEIRQNRHYRVFGNIFLQVEPLKGLTFRSQLSPQMVYDRNGEYYGQYTKVSAGNIHNTSANYGTSDNFGYVLDNQINFKKEFGLHKLDLGAVQSIQYEQWESSYQAAKDFPFNSKWYNLDAVTAANIVASQTDYKQRSLASFLGRLQYGFKEKYLFTATGRYDGSSRLAEGNKWAFFPSAAFAWRMSEESFLKNFKNLSNLKMRLSYGVTGNDAVSIYGTQSNIAQKYYDFSGVAANSYYKDGLANYDLSWEKTYEINFGLDYGFFDSRINGSIDVYKRDAKDLIMRRQLPETTGWTSIWDNVGWTRNKGVEFSLNSVNIKTKDFSWSTSIIFDTNKNEIVELYGAKKDDIGNGWFIGKPIQSNYNYEFDGIWQTSEKDLAAKYGQTPGQVKVKDLNGDFKIDVNDKKIIGQRTPKWSGSITNTWNYKNWDLSANVYTRQGQQIFSTFVSTFMALEGNYKNLDVDYWTVNNPTNKYPMPGNKGKYFDAFRYRDISFVRVGNISLGYNFPKSILTKLDLSKLRISCTTTNPFTFTSYQGFDPEWGDVNTWGEATGYSTYLLSVNLEF